MPLSSNVLDKAAALKDALLRAQAANQELLDEIGAMRDSNPDKHILVELLTALGAVPSPPGNGNPPLPPPVPTPPPVNVGSPDENGVLQWVYRGAVPYEFQLGAPGIYQVKAAIRSNGIGKIDIEVGGVSEAFVLPDSDGVRVWLNGPRFSMAEGRNILYANGLTPGITVSHLEIRFRESPELP